MLSRYTINIPITQGIEYPSYEQVFAQLSEEQKEVIKSKKIGASKTSKEWVELLTGLVLHDKVVSLKFAKYSLRALIIVVVVALIVTILVGVLGGNEWVFFGVVGMAFFGAMIYYAHQDKFYNVLFPDYLRTVLLPLLLVLQEETDDPIYLKINLQRQLDDSHEEVRYGGVYEWPFLEVFAKLKNQIDFQMKIHIQNIFRHRKAKSKRQVFIHMSFLYPKKIHQKFHPNEVNKPGLKIKSKEKPKKHILRLRRVLKYKDKPFDITKYKDVPMNVVLGMIREGYRVVQKSV